MGSVPGPTATATSSAEGAPEPPSNPVAPSDVSPATAPWWGKVLGWISGLVTMVLARWFGATLLGFGLGTAVAYGIGRLVLRGSRRELLPVFSLVLGQVVYMSAGLLLLQSQLSPNPWLYLDLVVPVVLLTAYVAWPGRASASGLLVWQVLGIGFHLYTLVRPEALAQQVAGIVETPSAQTIGSVVVWILDRLLTGTLVVLCTRVWCEEQAKARRKERACAACGEEVAPERRACGNCGHPVPVRPVTPRGSLAGGWLLGTALVALFGGCAWSGWQFVRAVSEGWYLPPASTGLLSVMVIGVSAATGAGCAFLAFRNGAPRFAAAWAALPLALLVPLLLSTELLSPKVKSATRAAYRKKLRRELSRENLISELQRQDDTLFRNFRDPQALQLGERYDGLEVTIPPSLPRVERGSVGPNDLGDTFSSGEIYTGSEQNQVVKVECYRLVPGYVLDVKRATDTINATLKEQWIRGFSSANAEALGQDVESWKAMNDEERAALVELYHRTKLKVADQTKVTLGGTAGSRTIFTSTEGFPMAARSEVYVRGPVFLNVVVTTLTPEELPSGAVEELFHSIRFSP